MTNVQLWAWVGMETVQFSAKATELNKLAVDESLMRPFSVAKKRLYKNPYWLIYSWSVWFKG